jgi:hypothetical protein
MTNVTDFADIEHEFVQRAHAAVWCNGATIDSQQRPRSRVLHPLWEGATGWITTGRNSIKTRHLAANPYLSLAYIADPLKPVYVECYAVWDNNPTTKRRIWDLCKSLPEPLGFDPALSWGTVESPDWGLLQLTPWRIELYDLLNQRNRKIWRAEG